MTSSANPLLGPFLAAAEEAAKTRTAVDPEMIREILRDAATMLHNGLALDGLDDHDTQAVVEGLCVALFAADPGAALREHARASLDAPNGLHDPETVAASYLTVAAVLRV